MAPNPFAFHHHGLKKLSFDSRAFWTFAGERILKFFNQAIL